MVLMGDAKSSFMMVEGRFRWFSRRLINKKHVPYANYLMNSSNWMQLNRVNKV